MKYISTRGLAPALNFEEAATCGLASDGGLYVPEFWPSVHADELRALKNLPYCEVATAILAKFAGNSVSSNSLQSNISKAYADFYHPDIAPLEEIDDNLFILELFHGPTFSFKDYALQFLGRFMNWSLQNRNQQLTIVGATSGDTGSAAIHAVGGIPAIELFMLHPHGRVTEMQRKQMTTSTHTNVHNFAVEGTFDDCQSMVKAIMNDPEVTAHKSLGAVNSINWGRVAAQVIYYFYAAIQLGAPDQPVFFAVPTGNFGNVLAAYGALRMGLPIEKLVVCTNENDILTRFFESGCMQKQNVKSTLSPSMDIQVSSNFERFLFDLLDRDSDKLRKLMDDFITTGQYSVDSDTLEKAKRFFQAHRVNDAETSEAIAELYRSKGHIVDPHTAVALASAKIFNDKFSAPMIVVSTAHPAKFSEAIRHATGHDVTIPEQLAALLKKPECYQRISSQSEELKKLILNGNN